MMEYVRFLAVFVLLFALLTASPNGMLVRLGLEHNTLIAGLMAVIMAGLIHNYRLVFAVAVLLLAVGANLSPETAANLGFDRDYAIAALVAALVSPWVVSHLED
jgi:hypothetical protein